MNYVSKGPQFVCTVLFLGASLLLLQLLLFSEVFAQLRKGLLSLLVNIPLLLECDRNLGSRFLLYCLPEILCRL
jgi:uncharacterized membrane-anchored protein YitT (DUF2179 family)